MSASLLPFDRGPRTPAPVLRRYRLIDLVHRLALEDLSSRQQLVRLRQLARLDGLPLPINPRVWGDQVRRGAAAICSSSLWDAAAIDAWLHRPGPGHPPIPAAAAALPSPVIDLHAAMRARAIRIATGATGGTACAPRHGAGTANISGCASNKAARS